MHLNILELLSGDHFKPMQRTAQKKTSQEYLKRATRIDTSKGTLEWEPRRETSNRNLKKKPRTDTTTFRLERACPEFLIDAANLSSRPSMSPGFLKP